MEIIDAALITKETYEMYPGNLIRYDEKIEEWSVGCMFFHEIINNKIVQIQYLGEFEGKHIYKLMSFVSWEADD